MVLEEIGLLRHADDLLLDFIHLLEQLFVGAVWHVLFIVFDVRSYVGLQRLLNLCPNLLGTHSLATTYIKPSEGN
jgi:hypothetical protein